MVAHIFADTDKAMMNTSNYVSRMIEITPNTTDDDIDIISASCFAGNFSVIACIRYSIMAFIILVTALLCVYKIYSLHSVRHQALHHYLIFYSSTISCLLCALHWILGDYALLDFIAQWFKQIAYLVVTHFFWTRAHRAMRRVRLTNFCLLPGLALGLAYCTLTVMLGVININYKEGCLAVEWVMMSSAELFITQLFLVAGFFISKRLDSISTVRSVRTSQKRKLWGLIIVFEVSAVVAFSYDLSMLVVGSRYSNCSAIFHYDQLLYSFIFGPFMVIKFALPVWALLATLEPIAATHIDDGNEESESFESSDQTSILPDIRTAYIQSANRSLSQRLPGITNPAASTGNDLANRSTQPRSNINGAS